MFGLVTSFAGGYGIYYEVTHPRSIERGNWTPLSLPVIGGFAILIGGVQLYQAIDQGEVGWSFGLLRGLVSGFGNMVGLILGFLVLGIFAMGSGDTSGQAADSLPTLGLIPSTLIVSLFAAAAGFGLGSAQWLMLRKQIARAGWWVVASTLGFGGMVAGMTSESNQPAAFLLGLLAYAAITAPAIVWLLRRSFSGEGCGKIPAN